MKLKLGFLSLAFLITPYLKAIDSFELNQFKISVEFQALDSLDQLPTNTYTVSVVKHKRGKAILFTMFTGLFGGHRIYFGTHHRTPIIYSITLGGLGVLPLVDLINIIFTKDLSVFEHKHEIIMWGK